MSPRSTKAETEARIEHAATLLVERAGERLYTLASTLMERFGVGRRQAYGYLERAGERLNRERPEGMTALANAWPVMIGRLWREAEAKGDRRTRAHIARTLRDVLPADQGGQTGDEQPDEVVFEIRRPAAVDAADAAG